MVEGRRDAADEEGAGGGGIERDEEEGREERVRDGARVEVETEGGRAREEDGLEEGKGGDLNTSSSGL